MKNTYAIIGVIALVIVIGLTLGKKDTEREAQAPSETVVEEAPVSNPIEEAPAPSAPAPTPTYTYRNDAYDFAVNLPGLVATEKTDMPAYIDAIVTFGVGDQTNVPEQNRVPNTMAVYIWNDELDFKLMVNTGEKVGSETIRGVKYDIYSFTNEDTTIYRYTTKIGAKIYDIGIRNRADIQKFFLLD